ncbi:glycosyltransferase family 1 protein [Fibrisoma montanum]|uniref:Glycosyltransferase family 1 protein n=2 Tax=Fibrisoma montanum TaxID=2305895 RepID=A0A418LX51_9BACT|nr:glycosyltransferase family 1 protein [Fibrisoma montanum]
MLTFDNLSYYIRLEDYFGSAHLSSKHYSMEWKLALISEHASPLALIGGVDAGGQNIAVAELAQHLAKLGYQIDIFTRWDNDALPETVDWKPGVRVIHIKAGPVDFVPKEELLCYMDEFTENTVRFIKHERDPYRLVHAHFFMSGLVAANIKRALQIPFAVTFHALGEVRKQMQGDCDRFPAERFTVEQRVIREADALIALCPQDRDDLINLYIADPVKIFTIPNGYNPNEFYPIEKPLARMVLGLDPNEPIILQLGRMVPRKGVDNVVRALGWLRRSYSMTPRLLIVGGESDLPDPQQTPEIGRLQQIADEEGVTDQVTFTGRRQRETLRYYYSAADVFVTTPLYEPFGITPLEAMACGTPVVGSAVGGIKHTVLDGETGFLVPPNDPPALAAKLAALLYSQKLRDLLSDEAIRHVQEAYTWLQVAQQTANLYELILAGQLTPARLKRRVIDPPAIEPDPSRVLTSEN